MWKQTTDSFFQSKYLSDPAVPLPSKNLSHNQLAGEQVLKTFHRLYVDEILQIKEHYVALKFTNLWANMKLS